MKVQQMWIVEQQRQMGYWSVIYNEVKSQKNGEWNYLNKIVAISTVEKMFAVEKSEGSLETITQMLNNQKINSKLLATKKKLGSMNIFPRSNQKPF